MQNIISMFKRYSQKTSEGWEGIYKGKKHSSTKPRDGSWMQTKNIHKTKIQILTSDDAIWQTPQLAYSPLCILKSNFVTYVQTLKKINYETSKNWLTVALKSMKHSILCAFIFFYIGVFKIPTKNLVYNHSGYRREKKIPSWKIKKSNSQSDWKSMNM